jgi:hypothetical protein
MTLDVDRFGNLRPFLFHLTGKENIRRIKAAASLESTAGLLALAGRQDLLSRRRIGHCRIAVGDQLTMLRDQDPLHAGAIGFEPGWDLGRFVAHINQYVFSWPGSATGPVEAGRNHFERYASEEPIILRVGFYQLLMANRDAVPLFCRFNSGAPRVVGGRPSPRGASTYQRAEDFLGTPSGVIEVVFKGRVMLPSSTQIGSLNGGTWETLASAAV